MDDLAFREARIGWRAIVVTVAAGGACYFLASMFGASAVMGIGGLTAGYALAKIL